MTQAAWCSPLLPLQKANTAGSQTDGKIGSGARFKRDLLAYLKAYGPKKTGPLVQQLHNYDFGSIRAALIASVPSKKHVSDSSSEEDTLWGWPALKDLMSQIPIVQKNTSKKPHIVIQVRIHFRFSMTNNQQIQDLFSSNPRPNKQVAQRRLVQISHPTTNNLLNNLPDPRRDPPLLKRLQLRQLNPHENPKRGTTKATGIHASPSLPMGRRFPPPRPMHRPIRRNPPKTGSRPRPRSPTRQDLHPLRGLRHEDHRLGDGVVGEFVHAGVGRGDEWEWRGAHLQLGGWRGCLAGSFPGRGLC